MKKLRSEKLRADFCSLKKAQCDRVLLHLSRDRGGISVGSQGMSRDLNLGGSGIFSRTLKSRYYLNQRCT